MERLKQKRYRAKLVKRHYLPKGNGQLRPLGIPAVEDKLLQGAVTRLLEAIYEQDCLPCSYGYRPGIGAVDAVDELRVKLQFGYYHYVVEADSKGFFDNLDHEWLVRMLAERIDDRAFLGLIRKWLRAGILDTTGAILHPVTGTPQGGVVTPALSNVYLHYVLDLWFERVIKPQCRGEACLLRYADDYICAFESKAEAERFYAALGPRLKKFGLALAPEKTRVLPFSRHQPPGQGRFEFLGFEFYWGSCGEGTFEAAYGTCEAAGVPATLHSLVSEESPSAAQRAGQAVKRQTPGVLQLLRRAREQREPPALLRRRGTYPHEVAQSAEPTAQL